MSESIIYCNNCGYPNALGSNYCAKCSMPITFYRVCDACGQVITDNVSVVCPGCGAALALVEEVKPTKKRSSKRSQAPQSLKDALVVEPPAAAAPAKGKPQADEYKETVYFKPKADPERDEGGDYEFTYDPAQEDDDGRYFTYAAQEASDYELNDEAEALQDEILDEQSESFSGYVKSGVIVASVIAFVILVVVAQGVIW